MIKSWYCGNVCVCVCAAAAAAAAAAEGVAVSCLIKSLSIGR